MEELYRRFGERTLRYLHGVLGDDASDAQQDTWIKVMRSISELSGPSAFRTWLFRVTRSVAMDHLRWRARAPALLSDFKHDPHPPVDPEEPDHLAAEWVRGSMEALAPKHREVLILRFWEDLTYPEIAVVLGEPIGTVRSRLYWAKRHLKDHLHDTDEGGRE